SISSTRRLGQREGHGALWTCSPSRCSTILSKAATIWRQPSQPSLPSLRSSRLSFFSEGWCGPEGPVAENPAAYRRDPPDCLERRARMDHPVPGRLQHGNPTGERSHLRMVAGEPVSSDLRQFHQGPYPADLFDLQGLPELPDH